MTFASRHSEPCPGVESLVSPTAAASYYFISEESSGHLQVLFLSPWNHHLVLVQDPEHGWYGCSTLEVLQVSHEPAPPVGLSQVSSPPPIFLMNKELFRESKGSRYTELSCYPIIGLYKFVDLLSVFLLPTYMATPLLPLLYQERKSSYAPSFFRGAHHLLEFSSPDSQLR